MTATASYYTIVSAIVAAENAFLGAGRTWNPVNDQQRKFIDSFLEPCRPDLDKIPEYETIAALSEVPINEFLMKKGFGIQLEKFPKLLPPARVWGAASVLDLLLKWKTPGTKAKIAVGDRSYTAARIDDDYEAFSIRGHENPIALVETENGDKAYFTVLEKPLEGLALLEKAQSVISAQVMPEYFDGVLFPAVDLSHEVDISWLKKMWTVDDERYTNEITQALQQTKLKMNHLGARVKDAVAIGGMRTTSLPPPPLVINRPFLFCIERPGLKMPLFSAYITEENWKDPGSLDM